MHIPCQGAEGSAAQKEAHEEIMKKLSMTSVHLEKTVRAVSKVHGAAKAVSPIPSPKFKQEFDTLVQLMEEAEGALHQVQWLIKFKKLPSGEALSLHTAQTSQKVAAIALSNLVESAKAMKALIPSRAAGCK